MDRLLPYHVFQHPRADLVANKGKRRATETEILQSELAGISSFVVCGIVLWLMVYSETKFALECFKRRSALEERFRHARTKSGKASFVAYILPRTPTNHAPAHCVR